MNDNKKPCLRTHSNDHKAIFFIGMLLIEEYPACRIVKNALGLFKPNTMFGSIQFIFGLVPFELDHYIESIYILYRFQ